MAGQRPGDPWLGLLAEVTERAADPGAEVPAFGGQEALEIGADTARTRGDVREPSGSFLEQGCAGVDLRELGRRGVVEPTRRVDDAGPYRSGNAGSADDEPTRKGRVVNPHPGKGVGDGRDVGRPRELPTMSLTKC